jgi:hypothetical protein
VKPDQFRHLQEIAPGPSKGGETVSAAKATFTRSNRATFKEAEQRQKEIEEYFRPKKIGIILAGGGAKGAYQAGAMKAIYEFLDERDVLENVKMVAGTSIGSWNGLFWYASFLRPDMSCGPTDSGLACIPNVSTRYLKPSLTSTAGEETP